MMPSKTQKNHRFSVCKNSKGIFCTQNLKDFLVSRKFYKFSRKSQTEIIGLAIIVVLMIIGMTFVVRFMLSKEPVDFKKQFTRAEIASNTLNTFLKSAGRDCNGLTMTELLQDCGHSQSILCQNGEVSCDYAKEAATEILNNTLDLWNIDYELKAFQQEEAPIFTLGNPCPASKKSKTFPIPTSSGTMFVKLDLCG